MSGLDDLPDWIDNPPMYYGMDGQPISMQDFARLMNPVNKRVAEDTVELDGQKYWVSTVWLGLDHSLGFGGPPLIFETMVFPGDPNSGQGSWTERAMDRYATREAALIGHQRMCEAVRSGSLQEEWTLDQDAFTASYHVEEEKEDD